MGTGIFLAKRTWVCVKICMPVHLSPPSNGTSGGSKKYVFFVLYQKVSRQAFLLVQHVVPASLAF